MIVRLGVHVHAVGQQLDGVGVQGPFGNVLVFDADPVASASGVQVADQDAILVVLHHNTSLVQRHLWILGLKVHEGVPLQSETPKYCPMLILINSDCILVLLWIQLMVDKAMTTTWERHRSSLDFLEWSRIESLMGNAHQSSWLQWSLLPEEAYCVYPRPRLKNQRKRDLACCNNGYWNSFFMCWFENWSYHA